MARRRALCGQERARWSVGYWVVRRTLSGQVGLFWTKHHILLGPRCWVELSPCSKDVQGEGEAANPRQPVSQGIELGPLNHRPEKNPLSHRLPLSGQEDALSQNYCTAWVSEWKIHAPNRQWEWKIRSRIWEMNSTCVANHGYFNITVFMAMLRQSLYVKTSVESGKFTFKVRSESGKLSTIGCHLPPKSTNFGTLRGRYVDKNVKSGLPVVRRVSGRLGERRTG